MSEARIINIEIKITDLEDQVDEMNKVIYRQQQQIDRLIKAASTMAKMVEGLEENKAQSLQADERPPHY